MNSRERMRLAMAHKIPDRVPVMCQLSFGYYERNSGVAPIDFNFHAEKAAEAFLRVREDLGFDGVVLNTSFSEDWEDFYRRIEMIPTEGGVRCTLPNGETYLSGPEGLTALFRRNPDNQGLIPIEEVDPAKLPCRLDFSDSMLLHRRVVEGSGGSFSVHGEVNSPFDGLCVLLGLENAMMALITHPDLCKQIMHVYVEQSFRYAAAQIDVGVDAVKISSPFAGGSFISREMYRMFVVPAEGELTAKIHAYSPGMPVYTHTCGFIGDRLDLMAESGVDGIECLDPPPLGNAELADAKKQIGDRLFIKGNMDSVNVLLNTTKEELEEYVKQMLQVGMPGGGYILSTACSVAPGVDPELLKTLVPLAEKYGRYTQ
jgi:uroporphyrinogen-III decarboxylase